MICEIRVSGVLGRCEIIVYPEEIPLPNKKYLQKEYRGKHYSVLDRETGILFVRWIDNNIVTVASTWFSRSENKIIQVPRPNLIGKYNSSMGDTDLMDQNIARYRIAIQSKKWWWCLFSWMLDKSIHNAWYLYNKANESVQQLDFRRDIVTTYLSKYGTPAKSAGWPSTALSSASGSRVGNDIRYDKSDHLSTCIPYEKRRRCAREGCSSSDRTMCSKWSLHRFDFHTK